MMSKTIYAIQHVAFEDLGILEDFFYQHGFRVRYFQAGVDDLTPAFQHSGLTIILGGPIAVYDEQNYPFLNTEIDLLKQRLMQNLPTLGICLGAQLIAAALDAKVYAGHAKEIGLKSINIEADPHNILQPLQDIPVLHWHGDTFDLPPQATLLASSDLYPHQAFQIGQNALGLQFHLEYDLDNFEQWLIGHHCELAQANIDIPALRLANQQQGHKLAIAAQQVMLHFLQQCGLLITPS